MNATSTIGIKLAIDGATQAEAQLGRLGSSMQGLGNAADGVRSAVGQLGGALAGAISVGQFIKAADAVTSLHNNLRLATGSATAATQAFDGLFAAAQRSRTSFVELGNTYASIARAADSLKLSQGQLLTLTETIGNAVTISGASAQASQAALVQLGQGLASGTLRGEELNSILEQTPRLAKALADGLGVSTGALRELGSQGKLTAEAVVGALQSQQKVLAAEVQSSVTTVGQAYTQLQNAATALVGTIDAASGTSGTFAQAIQAVATSLGDIQSAFKGVKSEAADFSLVADGIGLTLETIAVVGVNAAFTLKTIAKEMAVVYAVYEQTLSLNWAGAKEIARQHREESEKARREVDALSERLVRARQLRQLADTANAGLDFTAENARLNRQAGNTIAQPLDFSGLAKDAKAAKKEVDEFAQALDKVLAKDTGLNSDYAKTLAALFDGYQKGRIGAEDYADAVAKLIAQQPFVAEGAKAAAAAEKDLADARLAALKLAQAADDAALQSADAQAERLATLRAEIDVLGLSAQAVAALNITKAEQLLADKELALVMAQNADASATQLAALEREINLRKQIIAAMREKAGKEAAIDMAEQSQRAADEAARAWQKTADQIEQSLTDALMRGFESGKGFAEVLRDTIANMFKTLVLRPIVSAVVNPVAGAITGSLGLASTANAASGVSSLATGASTLSGLGAFGSGVSSGLSAWGAGGSVTGLLSSGSSLFAGGIANGLGTIAGALGPIALGIGAVYALVKSLDDSGTYHTGGLGGYSTAGGATVGDATKAAGLGFDLASRDYTASGEKAAVAMARAVVGILDQTASAFGQKAGAYAATAFADDTSKDGAWGALMVKLGDQLLIDWKNGTDRWPGREFSNGEAGAKEYAAAVAKDVRDYLVTQVPAWADAALAALGDAPTLEQLAETVTLVNQVQTALTTMGDASKAFAGIGEDVASRLVAAMGGAQAAAASMGSYYSNFYSDSERQAVTRGQFTRAAATIGITDLPTTRAGYRALVDKLTADGDVERAGLLIKYNDVFASFTENVVANTASLQQAAATVADNSQLKSLQAEERSLRIQEAQAFGDTAEEIRLLTDGMTDLERETFLSNRSLAENIAAQQRVNALRDEGTTLQADLLRAQGDEAGALALLTQNMGEAEKAQYLYNQGLRDQITAIDRAKEAARQLTADMQAMASAADSVAPKLLSGPALAAFQNDRLAEQLNAAMGSRLTNGLLTGADLAAQSIDGIQAAVLAFARSDAAPAAKAAVLQLAGSLIDLKQSAIDARRATAYSLADTAFAGVERAIATQRKLAETSRTAAEKLKAEVQGIFDALQSAVDGLFGSVGSTKQLQAAQGQQFIAAALAAARATGALPDGKDLSRAIAAATAGLDDKQFATQADADYQRLVLANELRDLQAISGDQLTEAERQVQAAEDMLAYLDSTYETAKRQLDELKGINTGVNVKLPAALEAFALALSTATAINKPISQTLTSSTGGTFNRTTGIGINPDGAVWDVETVRAAAFELQAAKGSQAVYQAIKDSGYTLAQAEKIFGSPAGSLEDEARKMGLPVFHAGTNYVPRTGYALLQQGEAVIPAAYNPAANGAGPGSPRLERLVEGLTAEVQRLQAIVNDGNTHQRRTADTLENVTEGGANMRTVAA